MSTRHGLVVGLAMTLLIAGSAAVAAENHARPGWMVGIGLGVGDGEFTDGAGTTLQADEGLTPQLRVGRALGRHFQLGVDYQGWLTEVGTTEVKYRRSLQNWLLSATWFPGGESPGWGGFYVKAGAGYALGGTARVELHEDPVTGEIEQEHGERVDESGLGLVLGLGYEWRLAPTFAAGLSTSFNTLSIGETFIDDASFGSAAIVANWYLF